LGGAFLRALRAERLKLRRSLTTPAILLGGLFVPAVLLAVRFRQRARTETLAASGTYWRHHWLESWESLSVLVVPLLLVLVTTLVVHLEYRHDTWKQVHASPVRPSVLFLAKLALLLGLLLEVFVVVSAGLGVAGWLPVRVLTGGHGGPLPLADLGRWNARLLVDCLPVVGIQYAMALRFRNVLVPLGVGVLAWIAGLVVINTPYVVAVPYAYVGVDYLVLLGHRKAGTLPVSIPPLALCAFGASLLAGYALDALAGDRGRAR
jgi:hypothetical protein